MRLKKLFLGSLVVFGLSGCVTTYEIKPSSKSKVVKLQGKCLNLPTKKEIGNYELYLQDTYFYLLQYSNEKGIEVSKNCKNVLEVNKYKSGGVITPADFLSFKIKVNDKIAYQIDLEVSDLENYNDKKYTEILFDNLVRENNLI